MHERNIERQKVLAFLYGVRVADSVGWTSYEQIKEVFPHPEFALSVLEERGDVQQSGKNFRITANGCEIVEDPTLGLGDQQDAERYRWLRARLIGVDFAWGDKEEPVVVFAWDGPISADIDKSIDKAMHREALGDRE